MTNASEKVATDNSAMEQACHLRWANPFMTWGEIAERVGRNQRQIYRWKQTEEWEITFRNIGNEYVEQLAPAAVHALVKAWRKGNPTGALEVLRSFGFLKNEKLEVDHKVSHIDEEIEGILEGLLGPREAS